MPPTPSKGSRRHLRGSLWDGCSLCSLYLPGSVILDELYEKDSYRSEGRLSKGRREYFSPYGDSQVKAKMRNFRPLVKHWFERSILVSRKKLVPDVLVTCNIQRPQEQDDAVCEWEGRSVSHFTLL